MATTYTLPPAPPHPPGGVFASILEARQGTFADEEGGFEYTYKVSEQRRSLSVVEHLNRWLDYGNRSPETMLRGCFATKQLGDAPYGSVVEIASPEEVMFWVARRYLRNNPTKHWADNTSRWERAIAIVEAGIPGLASV